MMPAFQRIGLILAGALLMVHGIAHAPGALGSLDLATFEDVSRKPNLLLTTAGDGLMYVFGVLWVLGGIAFLLAGAGIMLRTVWALRVAVAALVVSLPLTVLWYQDAVMGLVLNAAVLVAVVTVKLTGFGRPVRERAIAPG